jgi:hypothetical protein
MRIALVLVSACFTALLPAASPGNEIMFQAGFEPEFTDAGWSLTKNNGGGSWGVDTGVYHAAPGSLRPDGRAGNRS